MLHEQIDRNISFSERYVMRIQVRMLVDVNCDERGGEYISLKDN